MAWVGRGGLEVVEAPAPGDGRVVLWDMDGTACVRTSLRKIGWADSAPFIAARDVEHMRTIDHARLSAGLEASTIGYVRRRMPASVAALHERVAAEFCRRIGLPGEGARCIHTPHLIASRQVTFHNDAGHSRADRTSVVIAFVVTSLHRSSRAPLAFPQLGLEARFEFGHTVAFDILDVHGIRRAAPAQRALACLCASSSVRVPIEALQRLGLIWPDRRQAFEAVGGQFWMPIIDAGDASVISTHERAKVLAPAAMARVVPTRAPRRPPERLARAIGRETLPA